MIAATVAMAGGALTAAWAFVSIARSSKPFGPSTRITRGNR